ncbi:MAG: hypothetical protein ABJA85_03910 [Bacteroidota bacterium]
MEDYLNTDNETLLSLLAQHTAEYTKLYTDNVNPDRVLILKGSIEQIQAAIAARKRTEENTSSSNDNINFSGESVA